MTERRFTDKAELDPGAVWKLPDDHEALLGNRTLFPSTVVDVNDAFEGRLLVSGRNSRKLGETITKGKFKDYKLYSLTLEERATCPVSCEVRAFCYGNGMQLARRHRIVDLDAFALKLEDEIREILLEPGAGLMVRLHVLGDFPSAEYVGLWRDLLADYSQLAVFGYTHWLPWPGMQDGGEIGKAIESVKTDYPDRFRIRWSTKYRMRDGAFVLDYIPETPKVPEGIVCPAQTDATACCASCGLCWEGREPIAFIKHGRASVTAAAETAMKETVQSDDGRRLAIASKLKGLPEELKSELSKDVQALIDRAKPLPNMRQVPLKTLADLAVIAAPSIVPTKEELKDLPPALIAELSPAAQKVMSADDIKIIARAEEILRHDGYENTRPIVALKLPSKPMPALILTEPPEMRLVPPTDLRVEAAYQRDLSGKSIRLIRKIVAEWDWAKFKPPICAETEIGLFVIDGQHTAIAAASHPKILRIPVMIAQASAIQDRAGAFVAHNRDRLSMSPAQILHAEAVRGDQAAIAIFRIVKDCGAFIPRAPSIKGKAKAGEIVSASAVQRVFKINGEACLHRVVSIAVAASCKPITTTVIYALQLLVTHDLFALQQKLHDSQLADALHSIDDFEKASEASATALNINRFSAGARLIADAANAFIKTKVAAQ